MGRKVHPIGFRLGINQPWGGRWFAEGNTYRQQLHQDFAIRTLLFGKFSKGGAAANEKVRELRKTMPDSIKDGKAGISRVDVERTPGKIRIAVHTAKPGIIKEDIYLAIKVKSGLHHHINFGAFVQVDGDGKRLTAFILNIRREFLQLFEPARGQHHLTAFLCKKTRRVFTESR